MTTSPRHKIYLESRWKLSFLVAHTHSCLRTKARSSYLYYFVPIGRRLPLPLPHPRLDSTDRTITGSRPRTRPAVSPRSSRPWSLNCPGRAPIPCVVVPTSSRQRSHRNPPALTAGGAPPSRPAAPHLWKGVAAGSQRLHSGLIRLTGLGHPSWGVLSAPGDEGQETVLA